MKQKPTTANEKLLVSLPVGIVQQIREQVNLMRLNPGKENFTQSQLILGLIRKNWRGRKPPKQECLYPSRQCNAEIRMSGPTHSYASPTPKLRSKP